MKTNIKLLDISYYVNPEKRTVACVITCHAIMKPFDGTSMYAYAHLSENPVFQFQVSGVAKCHPDDAFDETKGKRIAESKAKKKVYKIGAKLWDFALQSIERMVSEIKEAKNSCCFAYHKETAHIKDLAK